MKAIYLPSNRSTMIIILSAILAGAALFASLDAAAEEAERVTESKHYSSGGRDNREVIKTSRDTHEATASTGIEKTGAREKSKSGNKESSAPNNDFWFYSADVVLFGDEDFDGYYSGIDLLFDADTIFAEADVYAVVYLSFEGADWEEYAVTETFTLFGASPNDDYSVVTDLVSGYPTGDYDILIELFDAFDDSFLAFIGPEDTSELSFLPLEDISLDTPPGATTVVINTESGGGSFGWFLMLGLLGAALRQRLSA